MSAYLPVLPMTRPTDLRNARNGELPADMLRVIGPAGSRLHWLAARAWAGLWIAAQADGIPLTFTPGGSYRTLDLQHSLFVRRWTTTPIIGRPSTQYAGQAWYLRRGMARAARPGTSNHGWGLALDLATGTEPANATSLTAPALQWLSRNAVSLGWSWEHRDGSEPWHVRYITGDRLPQRVLDIENYLAAVTP